MGARRSEPGYAGLAATLLLIVAAIWGSGVSAAEDPGKVKEIRIIGTNDLHNYLRPVYYRYLDEVKPWGTQSREGAYEQKARYVGRIGGMAHVATVIRRLRAEKAGESLVVDAGDTWHGVDRGVIQQRGRHRERVVVADENRRKVPT
jgi:2',3'-cyclic-nucleotide 2'-phosphodiesterase (5'-nucleotidase family)